MRRGDLAAAEVTYRASIAVIEAADGIGSSRLINPLVGLGETYMRRGFFLQANAAYRRALQSNHVAAGFYNLEQVKILDGLSESYLGLDKLTQANAQQRTQVAIQRHRSSADSPDLVPALYKLGRWYNRTGQYPEAREVYQNARRIIRESKGNDDPALVDSLLGEAITYENEGAVPASASMIKRALDLLDSQVEPDHIKRAEVLVALGDLYTLARQPRSARQRYGQAWQELSGDDALLAERDRYFARPSRISGPRLPTVVGDGRREMQESPDSPGTLAKGFVVASLTVGTDGQARNTAIIESDPPGLMDKQVLRALDNTAFRPQLVAGVAVAGEGVQFRHEFRYLQRVAAGEEPAPAAAPEAAGEKGGRINYPDQPDEPDGEPRR
jgi:tetratricopeptide (TPR) repeat protein